VLRFNILAATTSIGLNVMYTVSYLPAHRLDQVAHSKGVTLGEFLATAELTKFLQHEGPFRTFTRARNAAQMLLRFAYDGNAIVLHKTSGQKWRVTEDGSAKVQD
jgi:hypothetical protein